MKMFELTSALLLAITLALLPACGEDHEELPRPTCDELGELCHDSTTELGMECHEAAHDHDTTEEQCQDMEADCVAECSQ